MRYHNYHRFVDMRGVVLERLRAVYTPRRRLYNTSRRLKLWQPNTFSRLLWLCWFFSTTENHLLIALTGLSRTRDVGARLNIPRLNTSRVFVKRNPITRQNDQLDSRLRRALRAHIKAFDLGTLNLVIFSDLCASASPQYSYWLPK